MITRELDVGLNMPSLWLEKSDLNKNEYLKLENASLNTQISDLKTSIKIHKEIVQSLLTENGGKESNIVFNTLYNEIDRLTEQYNFVFNEKMSLDAKCLILEQINDEIKFKEKEAEIIYNQKITHLHEAIERKEFLFQLKEQKWAEIEKIMVNYARDDLHLQKMLADLRYICDDVSTRRNVRNVLQENDELKAIIQDQKNIIGLMTQRLQDNTSSSSSHEGNSLTNSDTKKGTDSTMTKLPDLNLFNIKMVNNEIRVIKKSESDKMNEQIRQLEFTIEKLNIDIRDVKSANYDLNDTNNKIMKKVKSYKTRWHKYRNKIIELKGDLKTLSKMRIDKRQKALKDIIEDIADPGYSDDDQKSVSVLTLSDAGSIYYPGKPRNSPFNKTRQFDTRQKMNAYHKTSQSKRRSDSSDSSKFEAKKLEFEVDDVFLPAESMGAAQFSDLKARYNKMSQKKRR